MRVMVADDAVLFREGLSLVLAEAGFEVTAQVADGQALLHRVRQDRPRFASSTYGCPRRTPLRGSTPPVRSA
jgi:DNA-binding NarL/FixJ family response regulator